MAEREKKREAPGIGGIVRVSGKNKERLEALRHPGQSYDGFLEELLNYWEEGHPKGGPRPISQQPTTLAPAEKAKDASWWWWPEQRAPSESIVHDGHGGNEEKSERGR